MLTWLVDFWSTLECLFKQFFLGTVGCLCLQLSPLAEEKEVGQKKLGQNASTPESSQSSQKKTIWDNVDRQGDVPLGVDSSAWLLAVL